MESCIWNPEAGTLTVNGAPDTTGGRRQGSIGVSPKTSVSGSRILCVSVIPYCRSHTDTTPDRERSCCLGTIAALRPANTHKCSFPVQCHWVEELWPKVSRMRIPCVLT